MTGISGRPASQWWGVVLNSPQPRKLARFYRDLFGWAIAADEPEWCTIAMPGHPVNLAFQLEELYRRPVWPAVAGEQQMMLHLDIAVTDLDSSVRDAIALGAELPDHQPQSDVRVLLDPDRHPFCLYLDSDD